VVPWPDPGLFAARAGEPLRMLAISDEREPSLDAQRTREALQPIDLIIGCGDLQPEYLTFLADAFCVPLIYVRGNHDVGAAWRHEQRESLPAPLVDGRVHEELGLRVIGFSGSPRYNDRELQFSESTMWLRSIAAGFRRPKAPILVISHTPPRGMNDDDDLPHRGFTAFRWLADRLAPPLWLHGHTALVRTGLDDRCVRHGDTLFYNCTGATLVELVPGM
jgi:Icc-related predicted phosphoesterase